MTERPKRPRGALLLIACGAVALSSAACKSSGGESKPAAEPSCREGVGDDVEMGAKTGVAGAKTGVKTGVEGVKQGASATGGFFEGGSDEAKKRWKEGGKQTKATAGEGADDTKKEAGHPRCK
jgi:hypothetical protein